LLKLSELEYELAMGIRERKRILENIARLRRAEKENPNTDVAVVREDLEEQLGGTVSRSLSANLLGVSHTALNNWISSGDVPVVVSRQGRKEIPIPVLLELRNRVAEERKSGRRKLHTLEPIMAEARRRAERMRPHTALARSRGRSDPHRPPELRSLAYHRALAPRLRRPMVDEAQRKLRRWQEDGRLDARYARLWGDVFALPMSEIRKAIVADDARGRDLRQSSPLAGLLSEPERRKIHEAV
jgi:hypothetical protein